MAGKNRSREDTEPAAEAASVQLLPPPLPGPPSPPPARRDRQTLVPPFDPEVLAREIEAADEDPTLTPPFDDSSYARIVESSRKLDAVDDGHEAPTLTAAPAMRESDPSDEHAIDPQASGAMGRAMYGSYLQSDYPEALVLAERVLELEPEHALAQLVVEGCRARLGPTSDTPRLMPSSVVRLKRPAETAAELAQLESDATSQIVIGHVDGVADVAMVADLAGIPRPEALERLHALLDMGMLEVVNG